MMNKKIVCLLLILMSGKALSEPSKSVAYLMNDALTMFDWGLYKIEEKLGSMEFKELDLNFRNYGRAEYDWDSNRINLTVTIYPNYSSLQKLGASQICKTGLFKMKEYFGYGMEAQFRELFGINTYFDHKGFVNKSKPETFEQDIENITKLTIQVYASKTNKPQFAKQAECTSKLLEKDIYFVDDENKEKP
jgi:hypothetical protein